MCAATPPTYPDLCLMKTIMWEAIQEIQSHLENLLHPDMEMMVNHVYKLSIN
jgi:hypothetical protein